MRDATLFFARHINRLARCLLFALLGATTAGAYQVNQLEDAYELQLSEVTLPASGTGSISFRSCSSCETSAMRLNATTKYRLNGVELALPDFLAAAARIREAEDADENSSITVFFNIQSRRLTRIELFEFQ